MALEIYNLLRLLLSVVCKWPVINVTLLTLKNSNTKYKTNGIFPNSINEIILALHVRARLKHQFETSVECFSAGQSYLCYIFMKLHIMTL